MATLNVKDALSYLDQVKVQFAEHPDVYNRFLDIMKDFKSQTIDTPGVIERVSTLFRGHPSLIQGFNTFLPPGYRIECSLDPSESNMITVTTPTGTTTQTSGGVGIAGAISRMSAMAANAAASAASAGGGGGATTPAEVSAAAAYGTGAASSAAAPAPGYTASAAGGKASHAAPTLPAGSLASLQSGTPGHRPHTPASSASAGMGPATPGATAGAGVLTSHGGPFSAAAGGAGGANAADRRPPVEFNHAISYVNRIKQRFSGDPDTYKQFLEILQTYQKEQRPIGDVYAQVTVLFNNDKDLLDEFKQFLPDTSSGAAPSGGLFGMLGQVTAGMSAPVVQAPSLASLQAQHNAAQVVQAGSSLFGVSRFDLPPESAKKAGSGASRSKKRAGPGASMPSAGMPLGTGSLMDATAGKSGKSKKSKHHHGSAGAKARGSPPRDAAGMPLDPYMQQQQQQQGLVQPMQHPAGALMYAPDGSLVPVAGGPGSVIVGPDGSYIMASGLNNGMSLGVTAGQAPLATLDEVAFFDRVKKHIDDRATYLEFLKLLNLYTQDIIDVRTLVDRASLFIGGNRDLFAIFQRLCGYEMGKHGWLDAEDPIIENVPALQRERVDLATCKVYGASYRKLPKSEVNLACSGRDPMCWEVLNDTWVSHPTWASEGESFNPHKKNVYEDALYRSEEERHEYDYHIEANLRTIALLEPIAARIASMDAEERAAFRLKPGLGGQSKSIYQRVVKKVYGREHGVEVIAALHDNPCVAVPVVLARLKQKDEEWKRAQREWNKVWREVDARNFYKSLDHQGVNFKASDKKAITTKAFVGEIEARRTQQQQRRLAIDPSLPRPRPAYQLVYALDDMGVLTDVLKLALSFLDRAPYSKADCDRIEATLRTFVPLLLGLDQAEFDEQLNGGVTLDGEGDDAESRADDGNGSEASDAESSAGAAGAKRGGLTARRQAADLRRKILRSQAEAGGQPEEARASSPALTAEVKAATDALDAGVAPMLAAGAAATETTAADVEMTDAASAAAAATAPAPSAEVGASSEAPSEAPKTVENPAEPKTWMQSESVQAYDSAKRVSIPTPASESAPVPPANGNGLATGSPAPTSADDKRHNFFGSTHHYVFVRLLQLLYARLAKAKQYGEDLAAQDPPKRRINPVALELGLQDGTTGPAAIVGAAAASAAANRSETHSGTTSANGNANGNGSSTLPNGVLADESGLTLSPARYYDVLLDICEKLFDGELDRNTFEECIRFMYNIEGHILYTLDKVISALVKTAQVIATDAKCQELGLIMEKDRAFGSSMAYKAQIARRTAAEAVLGREENLFRMEWVPGSSTLLVQMLGKDDLTLGDPRSAEQRWLHYISSYVLHTPTEGLPGPVSPPFLRRSLRAETEELNADASTTRYITHSGLELKVCIATYRLFFVQDTEDCFARQRVVTSSAQPSGSGEKARKVRTKKFDAWLEKRRATIDAPPPAAAAAAEPEPELESATAPAPTNTADATAEPASDAMQVDDEAAPQTAAATAAPNVETPTPAPASTAEPTAP